MGKPPLDHGARNIVLGEDGPKKGQPALKHAAVDGELLVHRPDGTARIPAPSPEVGRGESNLVGHDPLEVSPLEQPADDEVRCHAADEVPQDRLKALGASQTGNIGGHGFAVWL